MELLSRNRYVAGYLSVALVLGLLAVLVWVLQTGSAQ